MLPISIERLIATLYPEKYDHIHQELPILGIFLYLMIVLIALILCTLSELDVTDNSYLAVLIMFSLAALFFLILPYTSRRLFKKTAETRNCTVAARYQTAESLRSAHLLKYVSAYKTISNYLSLAFYYYCFEADRYYLTFTTECFYYYTIIQIFCQMLLTTYVHEVLRNELLKLFRRNKLTNREEKQELRSIIGEKILFSAHEEKEKYFQMYANAWDVNIQVE
ncbi:unnamed protein product, partial [Mesorhabditis belari]|uniref:Uncharacterized protein n=1 Tax=Mesorhabditis belari TaxID=2138241 RepID=A0AAF3FJG0_9BILA